MDYFCYVSRTKVDQLFSSIPEGKYDQWIEKESREGSSNITGEAGLSLGGVLSLFKGNATYGRKGSIQRERTIKVHYLEKLRKVLLAIADEQPIPSLGQVLKRGQFTSLYVHYQGLFKAEGSLTGKTESNKVITLRSGFQGCTVLLDCSLRFFSEGNDPDGTFSVHSGNARFFMGQVDLTFETIFIALSLKGTVVHGSPLFLKLKVDRSTFGDSHAFGLPTL